MRTLRLTVGLALIGIGALLPIGVVHAADDPLIAEGERVFNEVAGIGCKTCHGEYAEGDLGVGPFIRGVTEGAIRASIEATNEMVVVRTAISEDEIKAVAAFLNHLGTMQVVRTLAKRGRFLPDTFSVRPGTAVQLIIQNAGIQAYTFKSDDMGIDELSIPGRSSGSIEWRAPEEEGEYSLYCSDCKLKDQFFRLDVDLTATEFRTVATSTAAGADEAM